MRRTTLFSIVCALALAACSRAQATPAAAPAQPSVPTTPLVLAPAQTASPSDPPSAKGIGEPPPVKQELEATDPQTVNLSDGTPHLVEFFAFW